MFIISIKNNLTALFQKIIIQPIIFIAIIRGNLLGLLSFKIN